VLVFLALFRDQVMTVPYVTYL